MEAIVPGYLERFRRTASSSTVIRLRSPVGAQQLYAITVAAGIVTAIVDWRFR